MVAALGCDVQANARQLDAGIMSFRQPGTPGRPAISPLGTVAFVDGGLGQAVLMRRRHCRLPTPRASFAGFRFRHR
jgi:hypothetical protein